MKKRIITVLLTIITVIPVVLITPKANTTQTSTHTVTSYGDYTFQQGTSDSTFNYELPLLPINITYTSGSWMKLDYNFNDKYSGTMKLTVTSSADWTLNSSNVYWGVSADGAEATCYISATTTMNSVSRTKTFSIIFQNATAIHFNVAAPNNLNFFNSSQSITISNASFTSQPDMHDLYTDIHQLKLWWDLYIPGMSTSLSNIDSDLDNINQNIQALSPYIDQLEGYVDGLEGLLTNINNMQTYNVPEYKYLAYYQFSRFSQLDTQFHRSGGGYIYDMGPFVKVNSVPTTYIGEYSLACNYANRDLYVIYYSFYWNPAFNLIDNNGNSVTWTDSYKVNSNDGYMLYYQHYHYSENNRINLNIVPVAGVNGGYLFPIYVGYHIPTQVALNYNFEVDDTYSRLLQSINNGIGALNDDYDTSTYDNYEQTLDGLNDGLRGRFDNVDNNMQTNVDTLFTPSGTAGSDGSVFEKFHFNAVNNFMSSFINRIFTSFPAFKYILIFALLLLVIGVMI